MKIVLYVLAGVGIVLIGVALYVFLFAARAFVSESGKERPSQGKKSQAAVERARIRSFHNRRRNPDRRRFAGDMSFPLVDSAGIVVEGDRRSGAERRSY